MEEGGRGEKGAGGWLCERVREGEECRLRQEERGRLGQSEEEGREVGREAGA